MQEHAHWCAQVEERVRAEVRALRIDPMHDGTQVLSIIERIGADVVIGSCDSHDEQPSVASDVASVVTAVHHSICGFGPLQPFFDDDSSEEIWINEPGRVFVARKGLSELTPIVMTATHVRDLVERMLRWSGRRLDLTIDGLEVVALTASSTTVTAVLQAPIRTAFWPIEALIMVESSGRLDYIGEGRG